ncbi:PAS/PAC domain [Candidatus Burkholderia humilis]|nr:PAS/PAC domain [Candidatus Burkholderia humilis]
MAAANDYQRVAALFEALPEAYVFLDSTGHITTFNEAFRALTCSQATVLEGEQISVVYQTLAGSDGMAASAWIADAMSTRYPGETLSSPHFRFLWPSTECGESTERFWELHASCVLPEGHSGPLTALRFTDVTTRARLVERDRRERAQLRSQTQLRQIVVTEKEQELHESRELLAEVLAFARVGAWQRDLVTGQITCTAQVKTNLGLLISDELTETRLFNEIIEPLDRSRVREELDLSIAERRDYRIEYRVVWPNASVHWIMVGGRPRLNEAG